MCLCELFFWDSYILTCHLSDGALIQHHLSDAFLIHLHLIDVHHLRQSPGLQAPRRLKPSEREHHLQLFRRGLITCAVRPSRVSQLNTLSESRRMLLCSLKERYREYWTNNREYWEYNTGTSGIITQPTSLMKGLTLQTITSETWPVPGSLGNSNGRVWTLYLYFKYWRVAAHDQ